MTETHTTATQNEAASNLLDRAWELINAIGGAADSDYERGYIRAIDDALLIIEELGGKNPDRRNASEIAKNVLPLRRK